MSTDQISEKQVREGIKALMSSMLTETRNESVASELYKHLVSEPKYLSNPKSFFYAFLYKQENVFREAISTVKELPLHSKTEYLDIFLDFQFYKAHIEKICTTYEGSFACADKSGVLIGRYLGFLATGDKGKWEVEDEKCYWLPRFGTQDQWFTLISGLYYLRHGHVQEFLVAYRELITAGNQTVTAKSAAE